MVARTMFCTQETPANALATNKDATQIVIAGRSVFKVYNIEDEEFVERLNLRVGKNLNLNFSCADVVWNAVDDHVLATAATNGAVVTWNLNKSSRSKQDIVFQDHKRTVNKVCFHDKEPNLLISGSQDGTMKLFDVRKKEVTSTFYSMSESVRDVQFSPSQYFQFAAVQENGNVQLWDMRRTDRCERQFTAHNGPVFACDWHPEEKRWLATAGRDKTIKVWDVGNKPFPDHVIQTIASVSRIKWRPGRKFHLASSSLVVDFSVNVWDVRRPYIPYASFNEHRDVTSGILWRKDPKILLSVSKDCTLYQHVFKDAFRPADHINPIAMDLNLFGDVAIAASDRILSETSDPTPVNYKSNNYTTTRLPFMFRRGQNKGEQFQLASSTFHVFQNTNEKHTSSELFVKFAKNFQLSGRSKSELCDNNAMVATNLNCSQIATTWSILKILFDKNATNLSTENAYRLDGDGLSTHIDSIEDSGSRHHSGGNQGVRAANPRSRHHSGGAERHQGVIDSQRPVKGDTSGFSDDGSESSDLEHDRITSLTSVCLNNASDYFFGESDMTNMNNMLGYEYGQLDDQSSDWLLPNEPFHPRHEILDQSPPPELSNTTIDLNRSGDEDEHHHSRSNAELRQTLSNDDHTNLLSNVVLPTLPHWDFRKTVIDMLEYYAKVGNVQMCASVLTVFSDELKDHIDENLQEQWFLSYVDLLHRFQLWSTATEVIKLSRLINVNSCNQQSTTVHTDCNDCNRRLNVIGWWCSRCKKTTNKCSVCHQLVRGLYVWCRGCSHGGHLEHMKDWKSICSLCPTGCGHHCEYT